jgi:nucleotide-binding universal stress UspA family protein
MEPVHLTVIGAIIAVAFVASRALIILWMLRVPEQTPTTLRVAKAVRLTAHANRIIVPVQGTALSDRMVALGSQMAKARQATIEVFYVIEVPWTLPLNAQLPAAETVAREELERATHIAERYGVQLETSVMNAREAGRAIVEEATATGADIILMGDVPQARGGTRFSDTTTYVFLHAPCEVIIDRPSLEAMPRERAPAETVSAGRPGR